MDFDSGVLMPGWLRRRNVVLDRHHLVYSLDKLIVQLLYRIEQLFECHLLIGSTQLIQEKSEIELNAQLKRSLEHLAHGSHSSLLTKSVFCSATKRKWRTSSPALTRWFLSSTQELKMCCRLVRCWDVSCREWSDSVDNALVRLTLGDDMTIEKTIDEKKSNRRRTDDRIMNKELNDGSDSRSTSIFITCIQDIYFDHTWRICRLDHRRRFIHFRFWMCSRNYLCLWYAYRCHQSSSQIEVNREVRITWWRTCLIMRRRSTTEVRSGKENCTMRNGK